ncbi:phasin family protein [Bradyrhizobium sp. G127]|jgi:hypothetical protein|uniref:phasin family protein n=1 Tax=Bradyrhizobium sp. G127 TaxID=2904800 RepID=UPI001F1D2DA2|nr:phasin family protein [Bradyrhizobium sp. G127]MCF2524650.1 hypothetical protein [Bradyrhizobium sp. G127]
MPELHEQAPAEPKLGDEVTAQIAEANKRGLEFSLGAQKAIFDEMIEAGSSVIEHTQAQMNVLAEFASKVAEAHSFKDIVRAWHECSQHQMDVVRQDSQRFVAHGREILDKSVKLLGTVQA